MTEQDSVAMRAVGDLMFGCAYFHSLVGPSIPDRLNDSKRGLLDDEVQRILSESDVLFGNLECVLSSDFNRNGDGIPPSLMAPISGLSLLEECDFDLLNLANNHILDHGPEYVEETINYLERAGINYIGNPLTNQPPITIETGGIEMQFTGHYIPDLTSQSHKNEILSELESMTKTDGLNVVSLHWGFGGEHMHRPSVYQIEFGRKLVDEGADVVIGHHSHTLQPVERYNDGIIAYSLGNFIFDQWREQNRTGGILTLEIDSDGVIDADLTVTRQDDYVVHTIDESPIGPVVVDDMPIEPFDEYRKEANRARSKHKVEVIRQFISHAHKFPLSYHLSTYKRWSKKAVQEIQR